MRIVPHARARLDLAYDSLDGLSVGDSLGAQFFMVGRSLSGLVAGRPRRGPWEWTDDTEMACNLVTELRDHGDVDQNRLAALFADRCEPCRGYGAVAFVILRKIRQGTPWKEAAGSAFGGSCGNGAAMRVAAAGRARCRPRPPRRLVRCAGGSRRRARSTMPRKPPMSSATVHA